MTDNKMTHHTAQLLESLHQQTEQFLRKAIGEWQMLPPEALAAQPSPAQWSAAQCLEHLNIYGRYYLPAIEKAIQEAQQKGSHSAEHFNPGWLGDYFAKLMRPKPDGHLKSKMKAPKNAVPSANPDPRAMLAEFIDQQEKLLQLLAAAGTVNLNRVRIPISIAPWLRLKLGDTFLFFTAHIERHLLQAERAIASAEQTSAPRLSKF
ncbi:MAG TPA: DinB family protein [Saprospiraceae bacterium]|nr:DinB family protein [Saprospiraceae bacterium]